MKLDGLAFARCQSITAFDFGARITFFAFGEGRDTRLSGIRSVRQAMYRLFVGLDLPATVKDQLTRISGGVPGARWLEPEQMHLTLRFIGEVDGGVFDDVLNALDLVESPAFTLQLKGVGHFPPRGKPETLWVGVEKSESLVLLKNRIESSLAHIGLERDPRKFAPHVVIARLRDTNLAKLGAYLMEYNLYQSLPFVVEEFQLYSSMLSSSGAIYCTEATYPLIQRIDTA